MVSIAPTFKSLLVIGWHLAGFASMSLASADVLDVDASSGPYFEIRDAVAASVEGDLIRVHSGAYDWFGVIGKGISVVGVEPGVLVGGTIRLQDIPAGSTAHVARLTVDHPGGGDGVLISACEGSVRIEDLTGLGRSSPSVFPCYSLRVEQSSDVAIVGCTFGSRSVPSSTAARVADSVVSIFDSSFEAGDGSFCGVSTGAAGVHTVSSNVLLVGSTVRGGWGDGGCSGGCSSAICGDGGPGLSADHSVIRAIQTELVGGRAGSSSWSLSCYQQGVPCSDGPAVLAQGGTSIQEVPWVGPNLGADKTMAEEGETVRFLLSGETGSTLALLASFAGQTVTLPGFQGRTLIEAPQGGRRVVLGSAPAARALPHDYLVPDLPIGTHVVLHVQMAQFHSITGLTLGPVRLVHLFDSLP